MKQGENARGRRRHTVASTLLSVVLTAGCIGYATAQTDHSGHGATDTGDSPSTSAYIAANDKMHAAMSLDFTGNPDVDFARGMIAHHEGAVDMARVVLEFGDDPQIRQLAETIIAAQEAEISFMRDWLARKGFE
jgi:uncharacterized protein (DUF305 family)